ncbi:MAG: hypothetical protein ABFD54_04555 [Armatimonadota bacterium]
MTPPGTLIIITAEVSVEGHPVATASTTLVVMSPLSKLIGRKVYICGSWRGEMTAGLNIVELIPTPQGGLIPVNAATLPDGRLFVAGEVVDTHPP